MEKESVNMLVSRVDMTYAKSSQYTGEAIRMAALSPTTALDVKVFDVIAVIKKSIVLLQDELVLVIKIGISLSTVADTKNIMTAECAVSVDSVIQQIALLYEYES